MKLDLFWSPFLTVLEREVRRFLKVMVQTVLTPLINSALYLLIFGVSLGSAITLPNGLSYMAFLIPGLVMMGCLNNAFQNSSSSIIAAKFGGELEDFRVSPLTHQQIVWAMAVGGLFRGILVGGITYLMGFLFMNITHQEMFLPEHPWIFLFFMVVGGLSFAKLGISVAFWARSFDQLSAVSGFVLLPLIYLGGVFFSLDTLHPIWRKIAEFNPLLYLINGVRFGVLGVSDVELSVAVSVSLLSLFVFHVLALRSLRSGSFARW